MKYTFKKTAIIVLGGSIIFPNEIDWRFLKKFRAFINSWIKYKQFIIVTGGGRLSRIYQSAAEKIVSVTDEDKDWLGIHATRSNAHLLRTIFRNLADPVVIDNRYKLNKLKYPITIASGSRPGWSTDYIGIALAEDFKIPEVIIAGKPAYVYTKDNHVHKSAKPLISLNWIEYQKLIPKKWTPGIHAPIDPVGARLAKEKGITAIIIDGKNLKNFDNLLAGKDFKGSIIK
jgi:uridylate kinase